MALEKIYWPETPRRTIKYPDPNGAAVVTKFINYEGQDIHIVRNGGSTGSLIDNLWIKDERTVASVDEKRNLPASLALTDGIITNIECIPELKGAAAFIQPTEADLPFSINGVTVNKHTGEIVANALGAGDPDNKKNFNFIVKFKITGDGGEIKEQQIRVHVHDSLVSTWVTPDNLDVPEQFVARLTLYAEFSDGLIGDITTHPGISWSTTDGSYLSFTSVPNGENSGQFGCDYDVSNASNRTQTASAAIDIGSLLNQTALNITATANCEVFIKDSWETPGIAANDPVAEFIGGPGKNEVENVPNYLFLADGCKLEDKKNFKKIAKGVRRNLMRKPSKAPWNSLAKEVNFWMLFMPSEDGAITIKNEVVPINIVKRNKVKLSFSGSIYTVNTDVPDSDPNTWKLKWLVNDGNKVTPIIKEIVQTEKKVKVWHGVNTLIEDLDYGLEESVNAGFWDWVVSNEALPMSNGARYYPLTYPPAWVNGDFNVSKLINEIGFPTVYDEPLSKTDLIAKWTSLYDHTVTMGNLKDHVLVAWKIFAHRKLANKKNTALGTAFGLAPRADKSISELRGFERVCGYDRWQRYQFDYLFKGVHLKSSSGPTTDTWADKILPPEDINWGEVFLNLGKDFSRIIFLSGKTRRGGVQYQRHDINDKFLGRGIFANLADESYIIPMVNGAQIDIQESEFPDKLQLPQFGTITHEMVHSYDLGDEYGPYKTELKEGSMYEFDIDEKKSLNLDMENDVLVDEVDINGDSNVNRGEIDPNKVKWRWLRIQNAGVLESNITPSGNNHVLDLKKKHHKGFKVGSSVYLRKKELGKVGLTGFTGAGDEILDLANQLPSFQYSPKLEIVSISGGSSEITVSGFGGTPIADFPAGSVLVELVSAVVNGIGKITTSGTTINGTDSFFEVQVNPKSTTSMAGGSFIRITYDSGGTEMVETRKVKKVNGNTQLELDTAFSAAHVDVDYEIIQREADSTATDSYKEVFNFAIRNTIKKTGNKKPMTEYPFVDLDSKIDGSVRQSVKKTQLMVDGSKNVFDLIDKSDIAESNHLNIVGVFRNGQDFSHAIFHPTGYCQMRKSHDDDIEMTLCPVCRYVLVDKIDPSKHSTLENNSNLYPEI